MRSNLDINADMGESFGNWNMGRDEELLPLISTANMACGFHASDPVIMMERVEQAAALGVQIGAHPGLPDLMGFGRRRMNISPDEASAYILYQVGALKAFLDQIGVPLHHVKPHGAMYVIINEEPKIARAVMQSVAELMPEPVYYWPAPIPGHVRRVADEFGVELIAEFYVDTQYDDDGQLILFRRKQPVSIPRAVEVARRFLESGVIASVNDKELNFEADSLCIHGDGPNCVEVAQAVRLELTDLGINVESAPKR